MEQLFSQPEFLISCAVVLVITAVVIHRLYNKFVSNL